MNEYEEIKETIDTYLMKRFKYRRSLVYLTTDNVISTRRNSRIDLYLRIRRKESTFPSECLIIARISFKKERVGHGSHLSLIHISEPTRRVVISYAVFCLKKIFFNDTATTEIYTRLFVGSVRCV